MTTDLVRWVSEQIDNDPNLAPEAGILILAALEGDDALDDYLADGTTIERPAAEPADGHVEAKGVVLTSIKVEGFRGIGQPAELRIPPKPGLTVVAGRNGSGKSSFSEALELVLTGGTYRWANRNVEWRNQWRNIHHPSAKVSIGLIEEGVGPIEISSTWEDGATSVDARVVKSQRQGQPQMDGMDHLGWRAAIEQFRPILSYDELGGMLDGKQSELYDALASILGVEQLGDAVKRIKARVATRRTPGQAANNRRKELQAQAAASTDERAVEAAALLKKPNPDTAALRALVVGGQQFDSGPLHTLRALATLHAPDQDTADAAVTRLRDAKNALADAGAAISQRNRDRLKLLEHGLFFHATHGDQTCPVCRTGELDASWAETSRALAEKERKQFHEVEIAHQSFDLAFDAVRKLIQPPPAQLATAPVDSLQALLDEVRDAWNAWTTVSVTKDAAGADALIEHVQARLPDLAAATAFLRDAATMEVETREDRWQPLASSIAAWCDQWDEWKVAEPTVNRLTEAQKWLTDNDLRLKNERLAPIEAGARAAWSALRQESNVELGSLSLAGSATRRRVQVNGAIDGEPVSSFAVFSQGELHALALSLFLPRATLAQSPFRFVVLDDPVQAMDPAKVDGLVELLGELAKKQQVIVFSHDDRFPAALRRSSYDATIFEVQRGANSAVSISVAQDPTERYLNDAHGLIKEWQNGNLTDDDLRRTLPGLYRFAIEAAAKDRYFATKLAAGASIHNVERSWSKVQTTKKRVSLALFGEQPADHLVGKWISPPHRKSALGVAAGGFHQGLATWVDPENAHHDAERLVQDIRAGAK